MIKILCKDSFDANSYKALRRHWWGECISPCVYMWRSEVNSRCLHVPSLSTLFIYLVLGIEHRPSHILVKNSTTTPYLQVFYLIFIASH